MASHETAYVQNLTYNDKNFKLLLRNWQLILSKKEKHISINFLPFIDITSQYYYYIKSINYNL